MVLSPKLILKQSQQLVMTPQLMQAIKLLQYSNLELTSFVDKELEANPFLERPEAEDSFPASNETTPLEDSQQDRGEDGFDRDLVESQLETSREAVAQNFDSDVASLYPDAAQLPVSTSTLAASKDLMWQAPTHGTITSDSDYNLEAFIADKPSLTEAVMSQANMILSDPIDLLIAQHLCGSLDGNGYLQASVLEISEQLGLTPDAVNFVLERLQRLEPPGLFARSLQECLTLQLKEKNRFDPAIEKLIDNIELLAKHDLQKLKVLCQVDDEDLKDMVCEIKNLDPRPGSHFTHEPLQTVVPDAVVKSDGQLGWRVELNSDALPKVLINQDYYANISKSKRDDEENSYFIERLQTANWLTKALEQRASTILKVCGEIVRQQDQFLSHGVQYLRPLNLKVVAEAIGMHESTVSRVTSNKYLSTPRGIYELKYFFTTAIASSEGGETHSSEAVRDKIKRMIDAESPKKILSDDAIVKALHAEGVDIARRTVAKYREALNIPSSVQRRRQKRSII
ncbi:RNA polymerase factor sigma-54 [Polycladidibacter stylochi]|uniref:RNA polymerase factor sigma-54 n=1 Tax=Polycladidibacter stylochi TaxID=1807766 RepID=UPI00082DE447|nr:RNA polymerase factor sigma-54 [Pseudovibrio stylochi]